MTPRARRPPLELIPHIHRATHRIGMWLEKNESLGVTQAEAHLLAHLAASGPSTVGDLHRSLGHRRSTLTSVLDRLEARALIVRDVAPGDRRSFVVALTSKGSTLAEKTLRALAAMERVVLRELEKAEMQAVTSALERIGHTEETARAIKKRGRPQGKRPRS